MNGESTWNENESSWNIGSEIFAGIVGLAIITTLIRPGNQSANVINAMTQGFAGTIKAAIGTGPYIPPVDTRTEADRFRERAMETIGDFWRGFSE